MREQDGQKFYKQYDVDIDIEKKIVTLSLSHDKIQSASYSFDHFGIEEGQEEYIEDAVQEWIEQI